MSKNGVVSQRLGCIIMKCGAIICPTDSGDTLTGIIIFFTFRLK